MVTTLMPFSLSSVAAFFTSGTIVLQCPHHGVEDHKQACGVRLDEFTQALGACDDDV